MVENAPRSPGSVGAVEEGCDEGSSHVSAQALWTTLDTKHIPSEVPVSSLPIENADEKGENGTGVIAVVSDCWERIVADGA